MDVKIALKNPIRRIYFVWGTAMLFGFPITNFFPTAPFYFYWIPLAVIAIMGELLKQPIRVTNTKALILHSMWFLVTFGGIFLNYLSLYSAVVFPRYPIHYGAWWLLFMAIPQIVTGILIPLHRAIQIGLGIVWLIAGILMEFILTPFPFELGFYIVAALTGLPYLYIAMKK